LLARTFQSIAHYFSAIDKKWSLKASGEFAYLLTQQVYVLYKACNSERAWKDIENKLQASYYRSRVDHCWKIRSRKIRTDVGKFSFINRTIADWDRLPEGAIGTSLIKTHVFRKRISISVR
jgi:hypothetical protein